MPTRLRSIAPLVVVAALLLAVAPASARGGGDGVRVRATCTKGATATLRLRAHDGAIRVEFELRRRSGARERWRVVLVHERRVAWRGTLRKVSSGRLRVRRSLPDLDGADSVTARATGPRATGCQATATLTG